MWTVCSCPSARLLPMLSLEDGYGSAGSSLAPSCDRCCENLNFSRAAERLHIGQSTLSKQVYELESQLGFRLFNRNHQPVEVTDAGRAFVEDAREAVSHM